MSAPVRADAGLESLREAVMAEFPRRPDAAWGRRQVAASWGQLALVIAAVRWLPDGPLWGALCFVAMGWTLYRQYFLLHEACHQTLLPDARANRLVGRVTAALLFTSFGSFTAVHMQHHRLWGRPEDPGAVDYHVRFESRGQMLRFFLWPLLGLSVFEKVWTNAARPLWRSVSGRGGPPKPGEPRIEPVDVAWLLGVQALVFLAVSGLGDDPLHYLLFYVLPDLTLFLFLQRLRMYLEHGPLDYAVSDYLGPGRRRIARSHASRPWERGVFDAMDFRFHREHHLFPSLPSAHLPEIHRRFTRELLDPDDYAPSYTDSLVRLWRVHETREP